MEWLDISDAHALTFYLNYSWSASSFMSTVHLAAGSHWPAPTLLPMQCYSGGCSNLPLDHGRSEGWKVGTVNKGVPQMNHVLLSQSGYDQTAQWHLINTARIFQYNWQQPKRAPWQFSQDKLNFEGTKREEQAATCEWWFSLETNACCMNEDDGEKRVKQYDSANMWPDSSLCLRAWTLGGSRHKVVLLINRQKSQTVSYI